MVAKDRFDKLERDPVGKSLDPSSAGSTSRRFRRWLEFEGEKHVPLELEPDKPKPEPTAPSATPPSSNRPYQRATPPVRNPYSEERLAERRAEQLMREEELRSARDRARRARNRLLWLVAGFGGIGYLIYLLTQGGAGGFAAEFIIIAIVAIAATLVRGRGRNRWDD